MIAICQSIDVGQFIVIHVDVGQIGQLCQRVNGAELVVGTIDGPQGALCAPQGKCFDLIVGEIEKEVEFLDASIYHLDGPGALRHLDRILEIPGLNGVQWRYGAGQPSASHWIPVVKKIQAAGKCVEIEVQADELEVMLEEVDPEGVCFWITGVKDEAHAEFLMKMAEHRRRK